MKEQYVTVPEAATRLGVSPARICQLVKDGRLTKQVFNKKSYTIWVPSLKRYQETKRKYQKGEQ